MFQTGVLDDSFENLFHVLRAPPPLRLTPPLGGFVSQELSRPSNLSITFIHMISVYTAHIGKSEGPMNQRLNITLPEQTVRLLDRAVPKGQRSRLIDEAVKRFVREQGRVSLREQLERGAKARAERDLDVAEEWFALPE